MVPTPPAAESGRSAQATRSRGIQRATLVAIATNAGLAVGQIVVGLAANAFSLVADAAHTLSDLFTDVLVLLAGRRGAVPPDADHPYGHGRFETAATLILGTVLSGVGVGFLFASGDRLQHLEEAPALHQAALYMAVATLIVKEGLFRFTLAASKRLNAPLLEANAWHARSDAASSLVVAAGIGGSLAGYPFLEPLAAAVVGFLILRMGLRLAWGALRELVDTGLPDEELERIRATVRATPGVIDTHDLRTRRMADRVLCDTHVLVDPRITVSEGHRITDRVCRAVRSAHPAVRDVLVHVDAEDDRGLQTPGANLLPTRDELTGLVSTLLDGLEREGFRLQLHYLGGRVDVEVLLPPQSAQAVTDEGLDARIEKVLAERPEIRSITFFVQHAPS
ncbi:cation diffusion facilitator family transporter [Pseudazoarcus pumilus]|uniref:Cation-efflux pump n=1 Tax=Pseudazoarcus pumilus TaxID=2067960 RepID=A0A2I6S4X5_9RHOO|nr:cation diffusion facilitator family transporter [Pseudazoarcus pumilus]AUN94305.1 cation-efflux pump [Pseudazoarcus pumilus]